ncbi:MAG: glycerophosphodiester phosphodiesterase, partial [Oscillospiraceae bacterium]|nr:glycerophosphodiester phosphodiesterase [Oscillospiraceae bacterium]
MKRTSKRAISLVLALVMLIGLMGIVPVATATPTLTHPTGYVLVDSPAAAPTLLGLGILADGMPATAADLADAAFIDGSSATISGLTIVGLTRGVHRLQVGGLDILLVVKDADETEFVLFETNFSGMDDLPTSWTQGQGPIAGTVANNRLTVTSGSIAGVLSIARPVMLPVFLEAFPNVRFGADMTVTQEVNNTRYVAMTFNATSGTIAPYYHWLTRGAGGGTRGINGNNGTTWLGVDSGAITPIGGAPVTNALNQTNRYRLDLFGNTIRGYFNNIRNTDWHFTPFGHANTGGMLGFKGDQNTFNVTNIRVVYNNGSLNAAETPFDGTRNFTYPDPTIGMVIFPFIENVQTPVTSIVNAPTIVADVTQNPLTLAAMDSGRPASAILDIAPGLSVANAGGASLAFVLNAMRGRVIPVFRIETMAIAAEFIEFYEESDIRDGVLMSSDPVVLRHLRLAIRHLQGALAVDGSGGIDRDVLDAWVLDANPNLGRILYIYNAGEVLEEDIFYLQARVFSVWVDAPAATDALYRQLINGPNGFVTDNVARLYEVYESFDGNLPTMIRTPVNAAHRGSPSKIPQNTVEGAIQAALDGANAVEFDIMITLDEELVIFHDNRIGVLTGPCCENANAGGATPCCPNNPNIWELTLAEVRELVPNQPGDYAHSVEWNPADFTHVRIPTMWEYLQALAEFEDVIFLAEIKDAWSMGTSANPGRTANIIRLLSEMLDDFYDEYGVNLRNRFVVITFNHNANKIEMIREYLPESTVGGLSGTFTNAESAIREFAPQNMINNSNQAGMMGGGRALTQAMSHRGLPFIPWTYRDLPSVSRDYVAGVAGLTNSHAHRLSNISVAFSTNENVQNIETGQLVYLAGETVNRHNVTAVTYDFAPVIISGGEFIAVNEFGGIRGVAEGTAVIIPRGRARVGGNVFLLPGTPVAINVSADIHTGQDPDRPIEPGWPILPDDYAHNLLPSNLDSRIFDQKTSASGHTAPINQATSLTVTELDDGVLTIQRRSSAGIAWPSVVYSLENPLVLDVDEDKIYFDVALTSGATANMTLYFAPVTAGGNSASVSFLPQLSMTPFIVGPSIGEQPGTATDFGPGVHIGGFTLRELIEANAVSHEVYRDHAQTVLNLIDNGELAVHGIAFAIVGATPIEDVLTVNRLFVGERETDVEYCPICGSPQDECDKFDPYRDTPNSWAVPYVTRAQDAGIIGAHLPVGVLYREGAPRWYIAELLANFMMAYTGNTLAEIIAGFDGELANVTFPDVPGGHPHYASIMALAQLGILQGGEFG